MRLVYCLPGNIGMACLTLVVWFQLGEFLRFSMGEISDKGRGRALTILVGEDVGPFLEMRNGWTWRRSVRPDDIVGKTASSPAPRMPSRAT